MRTVFDRWLDNTHVKCNMVAAGVLYNLWSVNMYLERNSVTHLNYRNRVSYYITHDTVYELNNTLLYTALIECAVIAYNKYDYY